MGVPATGDENVSPLRVALVAANGIGLVSVVEATSGTSRLAAVGHVGGFGVVRPNGVAATTEE